MDDNQYDVLSIQVTNIDNRLREVEKKSAQHELLTQQSIDSNKELTKTLKDVSDTMIKLSANFDNTNDKIDVMQSNMTVLNDNVATLNTKINNIEHTKDAQQEQIDNLDVANEKNNIDIRDIVIKAIYFILGGGGCGIVIGEILKLF